MKTIKIPSTMIPYRVIVNGKEYVYEAGATVEVPDEVAIAIESSVSAAEDLVKPAPNASNQLDWNQINNKPFGDVETTIVPLGETEFVYDEEEGTAGAIIEYADKLNAGDVAKVFWEGTTYNCASSSLGPVTVFGNLAMFGKQDTGEPFVGICNNGTIAVVDLSATETVSRRFALSVVKTKKIEQRYIPFTKLYVDTPAVDGYVYADVECTKKINSQELMKLAGQQTFVLTIGDISYMYPTTCSFENDYYVVCCLAGSDVRKYHTAEWPGPK